MLGLEVEIDLIGIGEVADPAHLADSSSVLVITSPLPTTQNVTFSIKVNSIHRQNYWESSVWTSICSINN
jgi:hypothetical protein